MASKGRNPLVCAAICVPIARAASSTSTRVAAGPWPPRLGKGGGLEINGGLLEDAAYAAGAGPPEKKGEDPRGPIGGGTGTATGMPPEDAEPDGAWTHGGGIACWTAPGPTGGRGRGAPEPSS